MFKKCIAKWVDSFYVTPAFQGLRKEVWSVGRSCDGSGLTRRWRWRLVWGQQFLVTYTFFLIERWLGALQGWAGFWVTAGLLLCHAKEQYNKTDTVSNTHKLTRSPCFWCSSHQTCGEWNPSIMTTRSVFPAYALFFVFKVVYVYQFSSK